MDYKVYRLIGNIGSGKTTIFENILDQPACKEVKTIYEPVEHAKILEAYYSNPKIYAFATQAFFEQYYWKTVVSLTSSQQMQPRITKVKTENGKEVIDIFNIEKSILTDYGVTQVFTKSLIKQEILSPLDEIILNNMFDFYRNGFGKKITTHYLYLRIPPDVCLERIRRRGREYEQRITLDYLKQLHDCYEEFVQENINNVYFVNGEKNV